MVAAVFFVGGGVVPRQVGKFKFRTPGLNINSLVHDYCFEKFLHLGVVEDGR